MSRQSLTFPPLDAKTGIARMQSLGVMFSKKEVKRKGEAQDRKSIFEEEENDFKDDEREKKREKEEQKRQQKLKLQQIVTKLKPPNEDCIQNSDDYDTDLEYTERARDSPTTSSSFRMYNGICRKLGVRPIKRVSRSLDSNEIVLRGRGLQPNDILAICNAILENSSVLRLVLDNNSLDKASAIYIAYLTRDNKHLTTLSLSDNSIGSEGVKAICQALQENRQITSLNLSGNKIQDVNEIATLLQVNKSLIHLSLSHNEIGDVGAKLLSPAIGSNDYLKSLDLTWNNIRPEGGVAIAKGIKENIMLTALKLAFNGFADQGAIAMAEALEVNDVLLDLDLTCNRIFDTGLARLAKALQVNETLRTLRISNNPLTTNSAVVLLTAVKSNPFSGLECIDMSKTHIYKDAVEILNEVRKSRPSFKFLYAGTVRSKDAFAVKLADGISDRNPMTILTDYIAMKGLRLIDLFKQFDRDGSGSVSKSEFVNGLKSMKVPLTEYQLDVLIQILDTDGDGEVDYGELVKGEKIYRMRARRRLETKRISGLRDKERKRSVTEKRLSLPAIKESTGKSREE